MPRTVRRAITVDNFSPDAKALRAHFEARFANPRSATSDRFVWDYWHVAGQYTALRTPAYTYFPSARYRAFHQRLVWWGRRVLGCHDVSPPWMSCYLDGCEQRLHSDVPHGPFAFVYSLTPWATRRFRGGETLLMRDQVLDLWSAPGHRVGLEEDAVLERIEPRFDRLTVFDPQLPHGVERVEGAKDPRDGRLVIHGWFVQPRPFIEGPLRERALADVIEKLNEALEPHLRDGLRLAGLASFVFTVSARGAVQRLRLVADTTRTPALLEPRRRAVLRQAAKTLATARFPPASRPSRVTLPLVFEVDGG